MYMNQRSKVLVWCFLLVVISGFVSADLTTSIRNYWKLDSGGTDSLGALALTPVNITFQNTLAVINYSAYVRSTGGNAPLEPSFLNAGASSNWNIANNATTLAGWVYKNDSTTNSQPIFTSGDAYAGSNWKFVIDLVDGSGQDRLAYTRIGSGTSTINWGAANMPSGRWYHIAAVYNTSHILLYVNGTLVNSTTASGAITNHAAGSTACFAALECSAGTKNGFLNGRLDEWGFWLRALNGTEIQQLYNNGAGLTYPFTAGVGNFTITAQDALNSTALSTFNASITHNGTTVLYTTTTGTIETNISSDSPYLANVTIIAQNYFSNTSLNYNVTNNIAATLHPYTRVNASNANSGAAISTFNITWTDLSNLSNNGFVNTTTGIVYIPVYNATFTLIASAQGFSNESVNVSGSLYLVNTTVPLYPDPSSVRVYVYDSSTGLPISQNVTVVVSDGNTSSTVTFSGGYVFIGNLSAGNYSFEFSSANYTTAQYTVTVGETTSQVLNAYLTSSTDNVIFLVQRQDSTIIIENALITQSQSINGTFQVISSKFTDITGRSQFQYSTGVRYDFTVSAAGYQNKTFTLNPILFEEYNIYLTPIADETPNNEYVGVNAIFTPKIFYDYRENNATLTIGSPDGLLLSYAANITYPGGSQNWTGSNAYGGAVTWSVNITGNDDYDTVNLSFAYLAVNDSIKVFHEQYSIVSNSSTTLIHNRDRDYGLGVGERVLIAIIIVIIVAGIISYYSDATFGMVAGVFIMGYLSNIGFVELWLIVPSIIAGAMVAFWRSGT